MLRVDSTAYWEYALRLNERELLWRKQMDDFLPDEIVDCHAHSATESEFLGLDKEIYRHMMSTFPVFTIEQSQILKRLFFGTKRKVHTLRFAHAYRGFDHRASNAYLLNNIPEGDAVALYGIPDDIDYTVSQLSNPNVRGLKMYYQYFNPPATLIYEVFKPEVLETAQSFGIPIILHLPQMITKSKDDLDKLLSDFPRLTVVLAHLGLPHLPVPGLLPAYDHFSGYPNLFMDNSMIPSSEVTLYALRTFGADRIMYGTDEPLNLVRSKVFFNPDLGQQRLITEYPYHWVDMTEHTKYKHLATDMVHTHWQILSALQTAIEQMPKYAYSRIVESVFYLNAKRVFRL